MDIITKLLIGGGALYLAWNNRAWVLSKFVSSPAEKAVASKEMKTYECVGAYNLLANHCPEARPLLEKHIWPLMVPGVHDEEEK